ncbi:MAG TPA: alpha-E domain-containing protein [Vicinamibacterales bacterium]
MLSRVADSIYWMSRYIERAENVARFVDVTLNLILDMPVGSLQQWQPLVDTTGDTGEFGRRYGGASQTSVVQFLTFDQENPNSILSCLRAARDNARSVREIISSEMWEQINEFYLMVNAAASDPRGLGATPSLFSSVKMSSHLFTGVMEATMTHNEGWHFARLGRHLERADKTSRILDVKYFLLLPAVADIGTTYDDIQWAAVLRSASAFEMYRKRHGRMSPERIVEFLLLDREFPRAIHWCMLQARSSVHTISGTPAGMFRTGFEHLLGEVCSELAYGQSDEIVAKGVHEYLDHLQARMNLIGAGIHDTFFARQLAPPPVQPTTPRRKGQRRAAERRA